MNENDGIGLLRRAIGKTDATVRVKPILLNGIQIIRAEIACGPIDEAFMNTGYDRNSKGTGGTYSFNGSIIGTTLGFETYNPAMVFIMAFVRAISVELVSQVGISMRWPELLYL